MDKKDRWVYRRIRGLELTGNVQTDAEIEMENELNELKLIITAPILRLSRRLKKPIRDESCVRLFIYI